MASTKSRISKVSSPQDERSASDFRWQRFLLASSAVLLAAVGTFAYLLPRFGGNVFPNIDEGSAGFLAGSCMKIALVLAIAWLAAPQIERLGWQRIRGSLLVGLIIVILLTLIRPRFGAIAAALLVASSAIAAAVGWFRRLK